MTDAELTKLAAEKVMGWHKPEGCACWYVGDPKRSKTDRRAMDAAADDCWSPLADWRAAGEIVEKMRADGWYLHIESGPTFIDGRWVKVARVRWGKNKQFGVFTSPDFPRAITMAALLAVQAVTQEQLAESVALGGEK